MDKRKAIIIDLDGTLFNSKKEISQYNVDILMKCIQLGHLIIIATARPLRTVLQRIPKELHQCYLVLCNGAWIVKNNSIIYRNEIDSEKVLKITNKLLNYGYQPAIEANNCFYKDGDKDPYFEGHIYQFNQYTNVKACKVLAYKSTGIEEDIIKQIIIPELSYVITDNGTLVQIAQKSCTKMTACNQIIRIEGIKHDLTYAFGDDNNDIPLFESVTYGIAMGNATSALKEKAVFVTLTNDQDGVGKGISDFIFRESLALSS